MRTGCLFVAHFPCAAEARRDPSLAGGPLILAESDHLKRVLDCSAAAEAAGVRPGLPFQEAIALCPDAAFLPADPVLYRDAWDAVLDALDEVSPEVEDAGLGTAYLNLTGLAGHYRDEAEMAERLIAAGREAAGLTGSAGVAAGKFPALAAAISGAPGEATAVPDGREAEFLAPLDISLLPASGEALRRLRLLGLDMIGEVACLPAGGLLVQFGREGQRLWELSNGMDLEPLRPRRRPEVIEARFSFEEPVVGLEVIVAGGKQLLSRLQGALRGRSARELALRAELATGRTWERRLVFREAVSEKDRLAFVLRSTLANAPPPAPVRSLALRLAGLGGETGKQLALGERGRLQRQLEEAVRQLKARYGFSPVFRCVDAEPWSVIPEERQILVESDA
jgi:nucleotidyltransferase/DNA polymerase involved in DNA repair